MCVCVCVLVTGKVRIEINLKQCVTELFKTRYVQGIVIKREGSSVETNGLWRIKEM